MRLREHLDVTREMIDLHVRVFRKTNVKECQQERYHTRLPV